MRKHLGTEYNFSLSKLNTIATVVKKYEKYRHSRLMLGIQSKHWKQFIKRLAVNKIRASIVSIVVQRN